MIFCRCRSPFCERIRKPWAGSWADHVDRLWRRTRIAVKRLWNVLMIRFDKSCLQVLCAGYSIRKLSGV